MYAPTSRARISCGQSGGATSQKTKCLTMFEMAVVMAGPLPLFMKDRNKMMRLKMVAERRLSPSVVSFGGLTVTWGRSGGLRLYMSGDCYPVVRPSISFMRWRRVSNISKSLSEVDYGRFSQANLCRPWSTIHAKHPHRTS